MYSSLEGLNLVQVHMNSNPVILFTVRMSEVSRKLKPTFTLNLWEFPGLKTVLVCFAVILSLLKSRRFQITFVQLTLLESSF